MEESLAILKCENWAPCVILDTRALVQSPFSNGICEHSTAIIDDSVSKIIEDVSLYNLETALAWAVLARDCLAIQ